MHTVLRCVLLVSMVMEHEFLSYVVQHTHDRDALRAYLVDFLAPQLEKFICGGLARGVAVDSVDAFAVGEFVREAAAQYVCRSRPRGAAHVLPKQ